MAASSDFERILVKDDRLGCTTDKNNYGVLTGGQILLASLSMLFQRQIARTCLILRYHPLKQLYLEKPCGHVI